MTIYPDGTAGAEYKQKRIEKSMAKEREDGEG